MSAKVLLVQLSLSNLFTKLYNLLTILPRVFEGLSQQVEKELVLLRVEIVHVLGQVLRQGLVAAVEVPASLRSKL